MVKSSRSAWAPRDLQAFHPVSGALRHHHCLIELHVMPHNGGYVANLEFGVSVGQPYILSTPDRAPFATPDEALLAGARLVREALTGSRELPFSHNGDRVIMVVQLP